MDNKKLIILEAAMRVITAYGFRRTSMDDIANEAGISRPAVYQHFRNKEDVAVSCISLVKEKAFSGAEAASADKKAGRDRIKAYLTAYMCFYYRLVVAGPHAKELMDVSDRLGTDKKEAGRQHLIHNLNKMLANDKEAEEGYILAHAAEGIKYQAPDETTLVSRLSILVEHFVAANL